MNKNQPLNVTLIFFVSASVLGLISIALLVFGTSVSTDNFVLRKPLIGSVFIGICILGALAIVVPGRCNSILGARESGVSFGSHSASATGHSLKGHHVDCEGYVSHTVKISGRTLCAACSGLFLGAAVAIFGSTAYFFLNMELGGFGMSFLAVGIVLVGLGFVQFKFPGFSRVLVNALFVFGAFIILLVVDVVLGNLFMDLYAISMVLLWILTRVLLSQWDHSRICRSCNVDCELKKDLGV